jgi:hypothetical protein
MHAGTGVLAVVASASHGARAGAGVVPGRRVDTPVCEEVRSQSAALGSRPYSRSLIAAYLRHAAARRPIAVRILSPGRGGERPPPYSPCMPAVALDGQAGAARLANRFGAVLAVDGVALKQAVATAITVARSSDLVATVPEKHTAALRAGMNTFRCRSGCLRVWCRHGTRGCRRIQCTPGCAIVCERPRRIHSTGPNGNR